MIISVTSSGVTVSEPDDFRRFHIATTVASASLPEVVQRSGFGTVEEDGTAVLDIDTVRNAGKSASENPEWDEGWSAMIEYARSKNWVTDDGRGVRAHVEYERSTNEER